MNSHFTKCIKPLPCYSGLCNPVTYIPIVPSEPIIIIGTDFEIVTSIHCNVDWDYCIHTRVHSVGRKLVYCMFIYIYIESI